MKFEFRGEKYLVEDPIIKAWAFSIYKQIVYHLTSTLISTDLTFVANFKLYDCSKKEPASPLIKGRMIGKAEGFDASPCLYEIPIPSTTAAVDESFDAIWMSPDFSSSTKIVRCRFSFAAIVISPDGSSTISDTADRDKVLYRLVKYAFNDLRFSAGYPFIANPS